MVITCTRKISIINPVVTFKGKFPKAVYKKSVQGAVKEDREGLIKTRIRERKKIGHTTGWQGTEGNHAHSAVYFPIQQKPQTKGLEGYGSSSSAWPNPQIYFPMEHGPEEIEHSIPLGRTWSKFPEDISQRDTLQRYYGNFQRMEYHQAVQTP
ncbi:hypothetical protein O181_012468 [Austropuccinia psidii MF-1]|uniref:Uncharacterized protein n=1 Tax=Austropuccinia psidii MF-1 TaxID=1389203 RepID=A0A9Q3BXC5_9BASI|nr:hypothetical protein [Austropuccinia psidii MF-1]